VWLLQNAPRDTLKEENMDYPKCYTRRIKGRPILHLNIKISTRTYTFKIQTL